MGASTTTKSEHFYEKFGGSEKGRGGEEVETLNDEDLSGEERVKLEKEPLVYRSNKSSSGASIPMSFRPSGYLGLTAAPVAGLMMTEATRGGAGVSRPGVRGCQRGSGCTALWAWLAG